MTTFLLQAPLRIIPFAQAEADSGEIVVLLSAAAVGIAVVVGILIFATKAAHRRRTNSHPGLFASLCQYHKLDGKRKKLLKAIGQAHRVRYAARVFLDPTLFEPTRLPPALRCRADEILALRQQLFLADDTPLQSRG